MKRILVLFVALFCFVGMSSAQTLTKGDIQKYEAEVQAMMQYLEETLNFIGDTATTAQEKEIVFNESWNKIFVDDKVQVEDDLDETRKTPINKDVQAYLKDIDFFFKKANFKFDVQSIANSTRSDGTVFFKVTLTRHLKATTINNDKVDNVKNRFIEINLDQQRSDLKIASIYTTKINEKEELRNWWGNLTGNWKRRLGEDIKLYDSIPIESVGFITGTDYTVSYPTVKANGDTIWHNKTFKNDWNELDAKLKAVTQKQHVSIAGLSNIISLEPLSELSDLTHLDISGTSVEDISPLRSANKLKVLKANSTLINDISSLKYDITLEELEIANTNVDDLSVLEALRNLERLNIANTMVTTLKDLKHCPELAFLNASGSKISNIVPLQDLAQPVSIDISNTTVRDLYPLANLNSLQSLNISGTPVSDLQTVAHLENLKELYCSNTVISDLSPLKEHRRLSKIYCDHSKIGVTEASAFTKENPNILVIYDTEALKVWWNELPIYWKAIFSKQIQLTAEPSTEQLHEIINMKQLDLSSNPYLQNLIPVSRLTNLESLNISNTEITRLDALQGMINLENINMSQTYVDDISPLRDMKSLRQLNIMETPVRDLSALATDSNIEIVWADSTGITTPQVLALKDVQPQVTVVYQTRKLVAWWVTLNDTWKSIFRSHVGTEAFQPEPLDLQRILDLRKIVIDPNTPIESLDPLISCNWLESVTANNQSIRSLKPLSDKAHLKELNIQNNPLEDLSPIEMDIALESLNIENTQVDDLSPLSRMANLKVLNASGTGVKSLKPLSNLNQLEKLFINNTSVKNLSPIENIASLKQLKVYNTKVRTKTIQSLQQKRLDLNIVYY